MRKPAPIKAKGGQLVQEVTQVVVDIERSGDKILIPENIPIEDALKALVRRQEEEENEILIENEFPDMSPPEGALALYKALKDLYGFVDMKGYQNTFFGEQDAPMTFIQLEVAPGEFVEVPWGKFRVPSVTGDLKTLVVWRNNGPYFCLQAKVKGRDRPKIMEIIKAIARRQKKNNLYKGYAIKPKFPDREEATSLKDFLPEFFHMSPIREEELVFSAEIEKLIQDTLYTPIEYTDLCRKAGVSLKRGILLEGPYGVGKTLTARVVANKCREHGWTYIYLDDVTKLRHAIEFARRYQPSVIFAEDIDQVFEDAHDRSYEVNEILNSIDGVDAKNTEVVVVLTTNNVEKISEAMRRPGRLDAIIPVRAPDAEAVQRLIKLFAGNLLEANQDLTNVGKQLEGQIPAVIREVIDRSKLSAIRRTKSNNAKINAADLETAARGMILHMQLLKGKTIDTRTEAEKATDVLGSHIVAAMTGRSKSNGSKKESISAVTD